MKSSTEESSHSHNVHTEDEPHQDDLEGSFIKHEQYKDGILTIGCCGELMYQTKW